MKTKYKYIEFVFIDNWICRNKKHGDALGLCLYDFSWHQWIFHPNGKSIFSEDCLSDIQDFLRQLNKEDNP